MKNKHIIHGIIIFLLVIILSISIRNFILTLTNKNTKEQWTDGFGGSGIDIGKQTHSACNCAREGIKYSSKYTMPYGDDSNLYANTIYQHYSDKLQTFDPKLPLEPEKTKARCI